MIWWLFVAHLMGVVAAALAGRTSMRSGLLTAAVAPIATAVWATSRLVGEHEATTHELVWVEGLDLAIRFRTDSLALMMVLLVSGIGALVFVYAVGYFTPAAEGGVRFPASLLAFSTSMLGLVLSDSVWTLFIFWELTSVTSFLLVGHKHVDASVRAAARRALLITGGGGLALLAGLMILADRTGSSSLTNLAPISGTSGTVAAVLVLIGAATKSAQVPFHVWLPGAMAAPTPVSAYLHSATMVKAGVLLVAVTGPAFTGVGAWKAVGLCFGIASMFWGAIGALRHRDAKLILAWGTVSQLGLLITLFSLGTPKAIFAGVSILFAHALFKAALFLVVGEIDIRTGTRDIDELGGLWRSMPVTFTVAVLAGLSMAGAPPLLGFMAKEAAIEAVLKLSGPEAVIAIMAVVGGSVLTVAYTVRFLITVFGPGPATPVANRRAFMTGPIMVLGTAGVVGYFAVGASNSIVSAAAIELNEKASVYELIRWPGLTSAFVTSMAILAAGCALGGLIVRISSTVPLPLGASAADRMIDSVLNAAPRVTARIQHGSLPVYLTTLAAAAALATAPFFTELSTDHLTWWDQPMQAALAVAIVAAAAAGAFVRSRLGAALTLGAVGTGVSGLFVVHGAPDLALTQLLVETVVVVGFVIGLGQLGRRFPRTDVTWRTVRGLVAVAGGIAVTTALAVAGSDPSGRAPVERLTEAAVAEGGGSNVVNVVLTDIRALDTLGEVVVLATVAVGILALAKIRRQEAPT
ncbi:MAG: multicomponent Na+:H+ antiporter subunit A [Candidatus Aldehydirespiratoraceae bacterium]|jgi:multicomponent Na+:H+ antiporter subunit A